MHLPRKKEVGSQATPGSGSRRTFSEASKILHLPHKKNVGPRRNFSEEAKIWHLPHKKEVESRGTSRRHRKYCACMPHMGELLGGIENIAPAGQKGSRVTIVAKHLHLPHKKELGSQATFAVSRRTSRRHRKDCTCHAKRRWGHKRSWARVTKEFLGGIENIAPATQKERKTTKNSEDTKISHLPHKKVVGSQRTSRRHRKYCTCHTKSVSVTCDSPQLYTVRGQHLGGIEIVAPATQNPWQGSQIVYRVTSDQKVGRVTRLVEVWAGPGSSHLRPYPKGR